MVKAAAPRGRVPSGLIGMLVLIAVIENGVVRRDAWKPPLALMWKTMNRAATTETVGCDVLCFGDSQVHYSVIPDLLEARLGLHVYNVAVGRAQAPASAALLRRALDAGAKPRAVVVDFNTNLLEDTPRRNSGLWPEVLGASDLFELAWTTRDPCLALESFGIQLLPSIPSRDAIRAAALAALRGGEDPSKLVMRGLLQNLQDHHGAEMLPKRSGMINDGEGLRIDLDPKHRPPAWTCHPANAVYVHRFLTLAAAHDIPVYWLLPPILPALQVRRDVNGREEDLLRFIHARRAEFPNLTIVDARRLGLDSSHFLDVGHIDSEGAILLSRALAEALADRETVAERPRWVGLAAVREGIEVARRPEETGRR